MTPRRREDEGQAAVELALVLPLVVLLLLAVVQVALVVRDQVLAVHAAREGAREAAVNDRPDAAARGVLASSRLDPTRVRVNTQRPRAANGRVRVEVTYRSRTDVPLIGPMLPDVTVHSSAAMRQE